MPTEMTYPAEAGVPSSEAGRRLVCMIGPPADPARDAEVIGKFLTFSGTRVLCGGTTAGLVARTLREEVRVALPAAPEGLPPTGALPGIDLVCEGVITLNRVLRMLASQDGSGGAPPESGAGILYRLFRRAETVKILLGRAKNPVDQRPRGGISDRERLVLALQRRLTAMGKIVDIETY